MKTNLKDLAKERSVMVREELELQYSSHQETEKYIWSCMDHIKESPEHLNQHMTGLILAVFDFDQRHNLRESFVKKFAQSSVDFCKNMKGYGAVPLGHFVIWNIAVAIIDKLLKSGKPEIANIYFHKLFPEIRMDLSDAQFNELLSQQIRIACELQDTNLVLNLIQRQQMLKLSPEETIKNLINEARVYRDIGDTPNLKKTIETLSKYEIKDAEQTKDISWMTTYYQATTNKHLVDMAEKCFSRSPEFSDLHSKLVCYLLAHAQFQRKVVKKVHKISTLRRTIPIETAGSHTDLYKATHLVEKILESHDSWDRQMEHFEQLMEQYVSSLPLFERRLVLSVLLRWSNDNDKPFLTEMIKSKFLEATTGMSSFSTFFWFVDDIQIQKDEAQSHFVDNIRYSVIDRSLSIINLGIKSASSKFKKYAKQLASPSQAKQIEKEEIENLRNLIMKECQNLKGPALKLAQIFASINHVDSDTKTQRKNMTVSAIHPNRIADIMRQEVPEEVGLLRNLDPRPIGAASIGQVHRSFVPDIGEVVVKIQYPGIDKVVESDLKLIKLVLPIVKNIFPSTDVDSYYKSTKETFLRECNYLHEKEMQKNYRNYIETHFKELVVVPEIYENLSSQKVITMSYIKGMNLSELIASGKEFDRDRIAKDLYRILWTGLLTEGFVMGDPHLENFIYTEDQRLGFIDFGLSEQLPKSRLVNWIGCLKAARDQDRETLRHYVEQIELFKGHEDKADLVAFEGSARKLFFLDQIGHSVQFSPDVSSNKNSDLTYKAPNRKFLTPQIEDSMFLRFALLTNLLMSRFNAKADWGQIFSDVLEAADGFHNDPKNRKSA